MQLIFRPRLFCQFPGFGAVDIGVDLVGKRHHFAQRAAEIAVLIEPGDLRGRCLDSLDDCVAAACTDLPGKAFGEEPRRAAGNVDVLADQIAVDPCHEIVGIEVQVLDVGVELGRDVIAQPLRVHADFEIAQRADAGAARLGHLRARDGDEAVHIDVVRNLVAGELEHRRPEQGVEVDDVLADEMYLLGLRVGEKGGEVDALFRAVILEAGEVSDGRVQPDVKILARRVGNRDAEIGFVARDVPVAQRLVFLAFQPLLRLVRDLRLQALAAGPFAQERDALGVGQPEEVVIRGLQHRFRAGQCRVRIDQVGRRIHRTAVFARVAVLVLGAALGALSLDVAVGEKHVLHRIVELLDRLVVSEARGSELAVDVLRQFGVLGRIGRMPVVEADVKSVQILLALGADAPDQLLRRDAFGFRLEHDGCAVCVVGADEVHFMALHALESHPDIGLDVLHDMADVKRAIGIRQGGGD